MFRKKMIIVTLIAAALSMLFILSGCGSLGDSARKGVSDGISNRISGLISGESSNSGGGTPAPGGNAGRSTPERNTSGSGPERNFSGSSQTVPWPSDSSWARYGLSGLRQPAGTDVTGAALYMGYYLVELINGGRPAFDNLVSQIDRMPDSQLVTEVMDSTSMMVGYSTPQGMVNIVADLETGDITIQANQL